MLCFAMFTAVALLATSCGSATPDDSSALLQSRVALPVVDQEAVSDSSAEERVEQRVAGNGPTLVFGRIITPEELVETLAQDGGREQIVDAMVATSTATEEQAGCMLSNLSYETFAAVANTQELTQLQLNELFSALDLCGLPTS